MKPTARHDSLNKATAAWGESNDVYIVYGKNATGERINRQLRSTQRLCIIFGSAGLPARLRSRPLSPMPKSGVNGYQPGPGQTGRKQCGLSISRSSVSARAPFRKEKALNTNCQQNQTKLPTPCAWGSPGSGWVIDPLTLACDVLERKGNCCPTVSEKGLRPGHTVIYRKALVVNEYRSNQVVHVGTDEKQYKKESIYKDLVVSSNKSKAKLLSSSL
jgi:hypothetical protein